MKYAIEGVLPEAQAEKIGLQLVELFGLKKDKETGYYKTSFGGKTAVGLARCVERVIAESLEVSVDTDAV